ncbi:hypothetical protein ABW19_dt0207293 [Dactylella cylindrospora]|nr:hypothetical protein ABW19_dt0207293 [Dactylella cylindrospora]
MTSTDPPKKTPKTSNSGIQTLASGSRIIPSSLRADGSTRPERRVKPGFTPQEDIAKYQNKTAEAWRNRGNSGVPGWTEAVGAAKAGEGKKKKRSRKKKTAAADEGKEGEEGEVEGEGEEGGEEEEGTATPGDTAAPKPTEEIVETANETTSAAPAPATPVSAPEPAASADVEKKAKGLQKKIRQAQELKARKDRGETLLPEQLDKALRLGELIRDLEKLGIKYEAP